MFHPGKALPPPPVPPKHRNESTLATIPTYRTRPEPGKADMGEQQKVSDMQSAFSVSKARALFEKGGSSSGNTNNSLSSSIASSLTGAIARHPDAARKAASFGIQQAQKHPELAQKAATAAVDHARSNPDAAKGLATAAWSANNTSSGYSANANNNSHHNNSNNLSAIRNELETKLTLGKPPSMRSRPLSCEPRSATDMAYDQQQRAAGGSSAWSGGSTDHHRNNHNQVGSWDTTNAPTVIGSQSAAVRPTHSFNRHASPPKRPPPPKLSTGSKETSPVHSAGGGRLYPSLTPSPPHSVKEPHAVAKYRFDGSHFDELSCQVNDTILLKREVDEKWIYGFNTVSGQHGIIPIAFLDVKVPLTPTPSLSSSPVHRSSISSGPRCRALYDYNSAVAGDLSFGVGETIRLKERIDREWLRGETADGRQGTFPISYVQTMQDLPSSPSATTPNAHIVHALYDYTGAATDDLNFCVGDQIEVMESINSEWVRGRLVRSPDRTGIFPTNFVSSSAGSSVCGTNPPQPNRASYPSSRSSRVSSDGGGGLVGKLVVALYEYRGQEKGDLWFDPGDKITVTEEVSADWLKGRPAHGLTNQRALPDGLFPRSFVQLQ